MSTENQSLVFGPVPSRRLGQSLGINNIPPKHCTLSCVYCQLGRTKRMGVARRAYFDPETLAEAAANGLARASEQGVIVDYLTLVADGEPTLDRNLGRTIAKLQALGVRVAVITNATLLWRGDVRTELLGADLVSVKVDAVQEQSWKKVNRPHGLLDLGRIKEGIAVFAAQYRANRSDDSAKLITETMLIRGLNDGADDVVDTAAFVSSLGPHCAYLAAPIRPPAERWVQAPDRATLNRAYVALASVCERVEMLDEDEVGEFASTGRPEDDLLSIMAVHPMREQAVNDLMIRAGADWALVQMLVDRGDLIVQQYNGKTFYTRRLKA